MYYKYVINDKITRTWYNHNSKLIEIENSKGKTIARCPIQLDAAGEYFVYSEQKIYKKDFIKVSFEDFMQAVKDKMAFDDMFTTMLLSEGIEHIQLEVPMNTVSGPSIFGISFADSDKFINKLCRIVEHEYKIEDNYKVEVEALIKDGNTIIHRSFYTSDMVSLIRDGRIKISKV